MNLDPRHLPPVLTLEAELALQHESILGESPLWEEREQVLYWVIIPKGEIHRFDPATGKNTTRTLPTKVSSIVRREKGGLLCTLRKKFAFYDFATDTLEELDTVEGDQPDNRFNDGKVDRQGRFWAGTMNEVEIGKPDAGLYRFNKPGDIKKMVSEVTISNGTGWSPDGKTMYYTDTLRYGIYAYDFDTASGEIANRRAFLQMPGDANGLPDGLTVDAEGFVWSALVNYGAILRLDPNGDVERIVKFPASRPSCCTFGGANYTDLYITTARECIGPEDLAKQPLAGSIFRLPGAGQGLAEPLFPF